MGTAPFSPSFSFFPKLPIVNFISPLPIHLNPPPTIQPFNVKTRCLNATAAAQGVQFSAEKFREIEGFYYEVVHPSLNQIDDGTFYVIGLVENRRVENDRKFIAKITKYPLNFTTRTYS